MNFFEEVFIDHELQLIIVAQTAFAMFLGALIGIDREYANKPAGIRTQMIVAGASALIVRLGHVIITVYNASVGADVLRGDPTRVIVAIITGISFIGAGTIIRRREANDVEGLTTAASLLFSTVVGIAVALSQYIVATGATLLALATLWLVGKLQDKVDMDQNRNQKN